MQSVLGPGHLVSGRYRLLDQVGRGAMGIVWRSRDELLDREVAVKQIVLPFLASQAEARASYQRTLREARTAARLNHPGVVTVFDVIEQDGSPWIVMELIRARPLDQFIAEDGPLPPADAARLGRELLDALTTAHAAGVLHRDVKPSNVLIGPDGKPVLTDFGIATIQGDPSLTQAGMVVGTPGFAPPERVRGQPATEASDLWSLGATLYAAVEGRGPFDRAGGSAAIVASVATEPAPRAPSAGPLGPVIEALLRADPALRPGAATTARMLAEAETASLRLESAGTGQAGTGRAGTGQAGQTPGTGGRAVLAAAPGSAPEATTATSVVLVPASADPAADRTLTDRSAAGCPGSGAAAGAAPAGGHAAATAVAGGQDGAGRPTDQPGAAADGPGPDVIPDLMATPVFAELTMPVPPGSPELPQHTGALGQSGPLAPGGPAARQGEPTEGLRGRKAPAARSRRNVVLLAAAAAVVLVIGGVWIAFPGLSASLAQSFDQRRPTPTESAGPRVAAAGHDGHRSGAHSNTGTGSTGSPGPAADHTPSGTHHQPGRPGQSPKPSPSGHPSPSASPSPSPTPSPTGSGPGRTPPPAGYAWRSVTAASIGTTAGFRLAAPVHWQMTPGLVTVFKPPLGSARMKVNMTPFAVHGPVRQARHAQAVAIANHRYPHYHLVSILAVTFHGHPAATWTFWWRPIASVVAVDVSEVFFTVRTAAGQQDYVLLMSAPATRASWASEIFRVAMRTFQPLP